MRVGKNVPHLNSRSNHGSASRAEKRVAGDDPLPQTSRRPAAPTPDVAVSCHGSIYIFTPLTPAARDWVAEFLPEDAQQWAGGTVIEHRYISDVVFGARHDGLSVVLQ